MTRYSLGLSVLFALCFSVGCTFVARENELPDFSSFNPAAAYLNVTDRLDMNLNSKRFHLSRFFPIRSEFREYLQSNTREPFCTPLFSIFDGEEGTFNNGGLWNRHVDLLDQRNDDILDSTVFFTRELTNAESLFKILPIYMLSSEIRQTHIELKWPNLPSRGNLEQFNFIPEDHQPVEGDSARLPENDFPGEKAPCPKGPATAYATIMQSIRFGIASPFGDLFNYIVEDNYGHGSLAWVLNALDAVIERHSINPEQAPGVLFLPYNFPPNEQLDCYMEKLVKIGIIPVVPAGDHDTDACKSSPARSPYAFTIGAIRHDKFEKADFSNYGSCVDLYLPGTGVTGGNWKSDEGIDLHLAGTDYAAAAGAAAVMYLLDLSHTILTGLDPQMSWLDVVKRVSSLTATKVKLRDSEVMDDVFHTLPIKFSKRGTDSPCFNIHDPAAWEPCSVCYCFDGKVDGIGPRIPQFQPDLPVPGCHGLPMTVANRTQTTTYRAWLRGESGDFDLHLFRDVPALSDFRLIKYGEKQNEPEPVYDPHDELPDPSPLPPTSLIAPYCALDNSERKKEVVENWEAVASSCSPGSSEYLEYTAFPDPSSLLSLYVDSNEDGKGEYTLCASFSHQPDFIEVYEESGSCTNCPT